MTTDDRVSATPSGWTTLLNLKGIVVLTLLSLITFVVVTSVGLSFPTGKATIFAGLIACLVVGQILAHYTRLSLMGWLLSVLSLLAGCFLLSLEVYTRAGSLGTFPTLPQLSTITWFAIIATATTVLVATYGGYRVFNEGGGGASKLVFYSAVAILTLGAVAYLMLGADYMVDRAPHVQKKTQQSIDKLIGYGPYHGMWSSLSWKKILGVICVAIAVIILWNSGDKPTTKAENKGGH